MSEKTHRAREFMLQAGRSLPSLWSAMDTARQSPDRVVPDGVYITDELGARAVVDAIGADRGYEAVQQLQSLSMLEAAQNCTTLTTLACWRMTQGIYRIDPTVYETLIDTPLSDDIPADILRRLPEWCIYIETPGLRIARTTGGDTDLVGAFVRLDYEHSGQWNLVTTLDVPESPRKLEAQVIPLLPSLQDSIIAAQRAWGVANNDSVAAVRGYLEPIINILLYICAVDDVTGKHGRPANPAPRVTRRHGERLFALDGPRTWDVGVRMGAALRAAYHAAETGTGTGHSGPRGHIRRAHWHGFRTGPRKRDDGTDIPAHLRRFELRWMPPIPVNLGAIDDLPATIRRV